MKSKSTVFIIILLSGCLTQIPFNEIETEIETDTQTSAGNPSSYYLLGQAYKVLAFSDDFKQQGIASWYGDDFHGKKTSNGELYNMYALTAAHKTLPIPSYVKVINLKNKRSIVVRINDRGPYYNNRIIDLSYAAAQELDIHQPGTERVQIESITPNNKPVFLQLGVFNNPDNAHDLQYKVSLNALPKPKIKQVSYQGRVVYKVQIGPLYNNTEVDSLTVKLAKLGILKTRYVR